MHAPLNSSREVGPEGFLCSYRVGTASQPEPTRNSGRKTTWSVSPLLVSGVRRSAIVA